MHLLHIVQLKYKRSLGEISKENIFINSENN